MITAVVKHQRMSAGTNAEAPGMDRCHVPIYATKPGQSRHCHLIDSAFWQAFTGTNHYRANAADFEIVGEYADGEVPPNVVNGEMLEPRQIKPGDVPRIRSVRYLEWLADAHPIAEVAQMCRRQIMGVQSGMVGPEIPDAALWHCYGRLPRDLATTIENPKALGWTHQTCRLILNGPPSGIGFQPWMVAGEAPSVLFV